jgi:hypothetical protein
MDEPIGLELLPPRDRAATRQAIEHGIRRGVSTSSPPTGFEPFGRPAMSAVQVIVAGRVRLRTSAEQTHWSTEQELAGFIDEYIAATAAMPELKDMHDEAVRERDLLVAEFRDHQLRRQLADIEFEIGKLRAADVAKLLEVRVPDPIQVLVGATKLALQAAETFIRLAPGSGLVVTAVELFAANRVDFVRMAAGEPPEKLTNWDRLLLAAQLLVSLIPLADRILSAGGRASAQAVLRISARSGRPPQQVLGDLGRLSALQREHGLLRRALERASTWIRPRLLASGMRVTTGAEHSLSPGTASLLGTTASADSTMAASAPAPVPPPPAVRAGQGFVLPEISGMPQPTAGLSPRALPRISIRPPTAPAGPAAPGAYATSLGELEEAKVIAAHAPGAKQLPPKAKGVDWYEGGVETVTTLTEKIGRARITVLETRVTGGIWTQLQTVLDKSNATADNVARAVTTKLNKFYNTLHNPSRTSARDPSPIAPNTYWRVVLTDPDGLIVHIHLREATVTQELVDAAQNAVAGYPSLGELPPVKVVVTGQ